MIAKNRIPGACQARVAQFPLKGMLQAFIMAGIALALLLAGCGQKSAVRKGGTPGTKPYTIKGKTYYPLKSANGFVEEGIASWYGPGFHGKTTANGERYNQYAMTAAHKILPLGTEVRVTHLENGKSVIVRINDRGPFVDNRVIDLSKAAAQRLQLTGKGTGRVRVQNINDLPVKKSIEDLKGDFYIQLGAFASKDNAGKLVEILSRAGNRGRTIFGSNNLWNVQMGPWKDLADAENQLALVKKMYPKAFVVGGK